MKNILSLCVVSILFLSVSCGPASENREVMLSRAKTISDSMANLIKTAMQEAEMPPGSVIVKDTAKTAASNTTTATQNK